MGAKTHIISAEIEPQLKNAVETVLNQQGMTISEAVNLLFRHIAEHKSFPTELLQIPNEETLQALNAEPTDEVYHSATELFKDVSAS